MLAGYPMNQRLLFLREWQLNRRLGAAHEDLPEDRTGQRQVERTETPARDRKLNWRCLAKLGSVRAAANVCAPV